VLPGAAGLGQLGFLGEAAVAVSGVQGDFAVRPDHHEVGGVVAVEVPGGDGPGVGPGRGLRDPVFAGEAAVAVPGVEGDFAVRPDDDHVGPAVAGVVTGGGLHGVLPQAPAGGVHAVAARVLAGGGVLLRGV